MNENLFKITKNFFSLMWIEIENLNIEKNEENIYYVKLKTPDSSILIWHSGKNLKNINTILRKIYSNIFWKNTILHVEINDYLNKKDEKLYAFISKQIEKLNSSQKKEIVLPFFWAYDRKKIHNYINKIWAWEILTKSIWKWKERRIHIYKKSFTNIDLDWIWI